MADNRLYLYCPETGEEIVLGVAHGYEWRGAINPHNL